MNDPFLCNEHPEESSEFEDYLDWVQLQKSYNSHGNVVYPPGISVNTQKDRKLMNSSQGDNGYESNF